MVALTNFANDYGTGVVSADGFEGPNSTGFKPTSGIGSTTAVTATTGWATLQGLPHSLTAGTDTTPVVTETYIAELWIGNNQTITGLGILNGSAVAGNVHVGLFNSAGVLLAESASTAQAGIATLQKIPFTAAYTAAGPAMYYVGVQFNNVAARYRSHALGLGGASKKTGETYGTFTTITPPATFTADLGPIAGTY